MANESVYVAVAIASVMALLMFAIFVIYCIKRHQDKTLERRARERRAREERQRRHHWRTQMVRPPPYEATQESQNAPSHREIPHSPPPEYKEMATPVPPVRRYQGVGIGGISNAGYDDQPPEYREIPSVSRNVAPANTLYYTSTATSSSSVQPQNNNNNNNNINNNNNNSNSSYSGANNQRQEYQRYTDGNNNNRSNFTNISTMNSNNNAMNSNNIVIANNNINNYGNSSGVRRNTSHRVQVAERASPQPLPDVIPVSSNGRPVAYSVSTNQSAPPGYHAEETTTNQISRQSPPNPAPANQNALRSQSLSRGSSNAESAQPRNQLVTRQNSRHMTITTGQAGQGHDTPALQELSLI